MEFSLITRYSLWWIVPIAICAISIIYWLYIDNKTLHNNLNKKQVLLLAVLRFCAIFLLLILLLEPRIKYQKRIINKPTLIIAQDNSSSLRLGKDSLYYINNFNNELNGLISEIKNDYDVKTLFFGKKISEFNKLTFNESATDISDVLKYVKHNYAGSENTQLLLLSDGIYNSGANPRYLISDLGMQINCVQLGDTSSIKDAAIYLIQSNKIGFTNSKIPAKIGIKTTHLKDANLKLSIRNKSKIVLQEDIRVKSDDFYHERDYVIDIENKGLQRFEVEIKSDIKEYSQKNNKADFVVDILDSKRKIAVCFDQFHPDIAALKSALQENSNFELELVNLNQYQLKPEDYNLIILYQLPSKNYHYSDLFKQLNQANIPLMLVIGGNTDLNLLNSLNLGVRFDIRNEHNKDAAYLENSNFSLFNLQSKNKQVFENMPPLLSSLDNVDFSTEHNVLAYQKIKGIETQYPLIAFSTYNEKKLVWIFGEGFWRWKLNEYQQFDSNLYFNDMINRLVQYLSLSEKKDYLIVKSQNDYIESEQLKIQAELYNESYQLINSAKLNFTLKSEEGKVFNYQFITDKDDYGLIINYLPKGRYQYRVETSNLKNNLYREGEFIVREDNIESKNIQADAKILKHIAHSTQGKYFENFNSEDLNQFFKSDSNKKPTILYETNYGTVLDLIYLLSFITMIMILEWFLRKYWLGN